MVCWFDLWYLNLWKQGKCTLTCPLDPGYVKVRGDGLECLSPSSNTGKPEISGEGELVGQGSVSGEKGKNEVSFITF